MSRNNNSGPRIESSVRSNQNVLSQVDSPDPEAPNLPQAEDDPLVVAEHDDESLPLSTTRVSQIRMTEALETGDNERTR